MCAYAQKNRVGFICLSGNHIWVKQNWSHPIALGNNFGVLSMIHLHTCQSGLYTQVLCVGAVPPYPQLSANNSSKHRDKWQNTCKYLKSFCLSEFSALVSHYFIAGEVEPQCSSSDRHEATIAGALLNFLILRQLKRCSEVIQSTRPDSRQAGKLSC